MQTENIVVSLPFDYPHFARTVGEARCSGTGRAGHTGKCIGRALTPQGLVMPVVP